MLAYQTDEFPMFYARSSGVKAPRRVDLPGEVVVTLAQRMIWDQGGALRAVPLPEADARPTNEIQGAIESALARARKIHGAAITAFVVEQIAKITEGRSIPTNLALAENNATMAAQVAVEWQTF